MTNKSKKIAAAGLVAASYAVITIVFGAISYGPFQFRISEMLMFLPLFGTEYILGLTIGCFIANITGGLGLVDMVFGTLATLISCILVYYTPKLIKNEKLIAVSGEKKMTITIKYKTDMVDTIFKYSIRIFLVVYFIFIIFKNFRKSRRISNESK